jgi:hypothetical protein
LRLIDAIFTPYLQPSLKYPGVLRRREEGQLDGLGDGFWIAGRAKIVEGREWETVGRGKEQRGAEMSKWFSCIWI